MADPMDIGEIRQQAPLRFQAQAPVQAPVQAPTRNQIQAQVQGLEALKIDEGQTTDIIKVEVSRINGNPVEKDLNYEEVKELWTRGLGRPLNELDGHVPFRHSSGLARINYRLLNPVNITTFVTTPFFEFERHNGLGDLEVFTCKILDVKSEKVVAAGDRVKVTVRHTHQEVPADIINQWLTQYGQVVEGTTG